MAQPVNIRDCKKAVNQAMYNPTKERKASAVKMLKALLAQVEALEESKPTPKHKAKPKRRSKNTKLEVQAQRISRGTAQTYIPDAVEREALEITKKVIQAGPREEDLLRDAEGNIVGVDNQAIAERAQAKQYPEYAELRDAGYSVEDAVRYVMALMDGAPAPVEATDELPF